ncbi:Cytochrome C and Quinol oxidase polypeptide I [Gracilibacillus ureilyticus]|uniref:Cytochrome C and Quinol oxidase polypeptide I n=1 Tax=Gracilibacillus ureilyticus TaxID=531814 RepID=A0A1H9MNW2_9BACI|nr:cytochrome-c oxidase [Gracilibacillus ureilyticus]SER24823.1 Cytochrome C and Quinol oxidase polypeptide I [Gracilibacillus ureilyticus]
MAAKFLKIAVVYFVTGVLLGLTMGITQNFSFTSVHAHINLLGWVSLALIGVIYYCYPQAGTTSLAKAHFWLHNLGLPIMQGALFIMLLTGNHSMAGVTIAGSLMLVIGVILFLINIFKNVSDVKDVPFIKNNAM